MPELSPMVAELKSLLPVIQEKEAKGLIKSRSFGQAKDLVHWVEIGRTLSEAQERLILVLLNRAKRKHRGGANISVQNTVVEKVDIDAVTKQVLDKIGNRQVDVEAVAQVVLRSLEKRVPNKVTIEIKDYDGKIKKLKSDAHCQFQHLLKAGTTRLPNGLVPGIFLQGEASSGKTTGSKMLAEALGLAWHFNGAISFPHEMLGFIDGAGKYHRTPFREAYEKGGVYTFDEVDRSDPVALLAVNPHLAGDVATFPDKQIRRHKDCVIVCTANTWGLGANAEYSGATKLDAAFLSRFPIRINWDIDPLLEEKIVPNVEWLRKVRAARTKARLTGLKIMVDTRVALAGAALISSGYTLKEAASMTYLANLKPEQRSLLGEV